MSVASESIGLGITSSEWVWVLYNPQNYSNSCAHSRIDAGLYESVWIEPEHNVEHSHTQTYTIIFPTRGFLCAHFCCVDHTQSDQYTRFTPAKAIVVPNQTTVHTRNTHMRTTHATDAHHTPRRRLISSSERLPCLRLPGLTTIRYNNNSCGATNGISHADENETNTTHTIRDWGLGSASEEPRLAKSFISVQCVMFLCFGLCIFK